MTMIMTMMMTMAMTMMMTKNVFAGHDGPKK